MAKLAHYFTSALLILPSALQAGHGIVEKAKLPMPYLLSQWKICCDTAQKDGSTVTRYILEKETMENWSELVNIQFKDAKTLSCADAVQALKEESALNKGVIYKVYEQKEDELLFEKIFPTGEHELVRLIMTKKGLHRLAYVKRNGMLSDQDRSQWKERLSQGKIETIFK